MLSMDQIYFPSLNIFMNRILLTALKYFFYFQIQTYPIGYYGVRASGGNISLDLLVAEQEERGWRTLQISAGQLSEMESLFPVQELDIFSGWEGQNAITLCGSLSWQHELEIALLKFEWHELRKTLWGWICLKSLSAWIILVPTPPNSWCLDSFLSLQWNVYVDQGRLGKGISGLAYSWRNVIVNWVKTLKEMIKKNSKTLPLSKLPSKWSYLHLPRSHILACKHLRKFGLRWAIKKKSHGPSQNNESCEGTWRFNKYHSLLSMLWLLCLCWETGWKSKANRAKIPPLGQ